MRSAALVLAGGTGSRMRTVGTVAGADTPQTKKQFLTLQGRPLICHALAVFEASVSIDDIVLVCGEEDIAYCEKEIVGAYGFSKVRRIVAGGRERYHSVHAGLCALREIPGYELAHRENEKEKESIVLIHDGARPFVTSEIIDRVVQGVRRYGACVAAMPVKDTIKSSDEDGFVTATPDRRSLWAMQTPQGFSFPVAYEAYSGLMTETDEDFFLRLTDDAMVVERFCPAQPVLLVRGAYTNLKITTPEDLVIASALCSRA